MTHLRKRIARAALLAVLLAGGTTAQAATFTSGSLTIETSTTAPGSASAAPTGTFSGSEGGQIVTGTTGNYKDPFTGTAFAGLTDYVAVLNGAFTLSFSTLQSSISFLWGTPDTYNSVSFYKNNVLVDTLLGTTFLSGSGASNGSTPFVDTIISVFGGFDSVSFASTSHTFEVGSIAATAVPAPLAAAGLPATLAALVGFAMWRRRKAG